MNHQQYQDQVIDYYEKTEVSYRDVWDLDHSLALHYGFWDQKVRSIRQALLFQNQWMADRVGLTKEDYLLDAGCGIGGSAIHLAKHRGIKAVGVNIVPYQIEQARQKASEHGVSEQLQFILADYCQMPFENDTFSVVWAIESVCHALDKEAFLKEAFRVLKPKGRLIIADGYRVHRALNDQEESIMRRWEHGYAVSKLDDESSFSDSIDRAGFDHKVIEDVTHLVMPSSKRLYWLAQAAKTIGWTKAIFGKKYGDEITQKNTDAAVSQYLGLKRNLWKYMVFMAEKPA